MAKYNAANHAIESDTGELLATLTPAVRSDEGFTIADNWGESATKELRDQIEDLDAEIARVESKNDELRDQIRDLDAEIARVESKNDELRDEIRDLEDDNRRLEAEKGDAQ